MAGQPLARSLPSSSWPFPGGHSQRPQALGQRAEVSQAPRRVAELSWTLASGLGAASSWLPCSLGSCTGNDPPGLELGTGNLSDKAGVVASRPTLRSVIRCQEVLERGRDQTGSEGCVRPASGLSSRPLACRLRIPNVSSEHGCHLSCYYALYTI